ncbi:hypothetical protein EVAR_26074_1 [Eumeta japonica]|uniref:Uncharacterized protein n=1 Tax=Eumeta variegata TaxID=151549 RepID=A0A4C1VQP5_EUMVA|nr:hypothetical protein EVAR_26074_1 [Eumeta japonica]
MDEMSTYIMQFLQNPQVFKLRTTGIRFESNALYTCAVQHTKLCRSKLPANDAMRRFSTPGPFFLLSHFLILRHYAAFLTNFTSAKLQRNRTTATDGTLVQYNTRNSAVVKLVTKASQWLEIGTRGKKKEESESV